MRKIQIVALTVLFSLLFSCCGVGIYASESAATVEADVTFLTALGIYSEADAMLYENENISREELASILSVFYGVTAEEYVTGTDFADVAENWSSGHIMTMVENGIMSGYEDGLFRPRELVTIDQVIKILVSMTGYNIKADAVGGFPNGYYKVAGELGILKNVSFADRSAAITKGEFSALLVNALKAPVLVQTTFGSENKFESDKDKTLLSERLDIYTTTGTVNAVGDTSLDYGSSAVGHLRIDSTDFLCNLDAGSYLGLDVKAYFRQAFDDYIGEILYLEVRDDSNVTIIPAEDILSATLTKVQYDDGRRTKSVSIPKDVVVVFNGKRLTFFTEKMLTPAMGELRFVDANHDGSYEYLMIDSALTYFVSDIVNEDNLVSVLDKTGKVSFKIDLASKDVSYQIFAGSRQAAISDLAAGQVLSVYADSVNLETGVVLNTSTMFKIYISDAVVDGVASVIDDDVVVIDEVSYPLAKDFVGGSYDILPGETQTFYLNYRGEVYAASSTVAASNYAILIQKDSGSNTGLTKKLRLRLFTAASEVLDLECVDKLSIDGYRQKSAADAASYLVKSAKTYAELTRMDPISGGVFQLVKYELNAEGKLRSVDTILENSHPAENDLKHSATAPDGNKNWFGASGCFNGLYGVSPETIFFSINGDVDDADSYTLTPYDGIYGTSSNLAFFNADDLNVAQVAVLRSGSKANLDTTEDINLMVVAEIIRKVNKEGDEATFISGLLLKSRTMAEIEVSDSALAEVTPQTGDFIRWVADRNGVATMIEKSMSPDGSGTYTKGDAPGGTFYSTVRLSYGRAARLSDGYLQQYYANVADPHYEPTRTYVVYGVFILDTQKKTIRPSSLSEIRTEEHYGTEGADMLGAYYRSGNMNTIIIYR